MERTHRDILESTVTQFGPHAEITKTIEQLGKLIVQLARWQNDTGFRIKLIEELAEASVLMSELKIYFGEDLVDERVQQKMKLMKLLLPPDVSPNEQERGAIGF